MTEIKSYVKKPIPIQALQFDGQNVQEIITFLGDFPHRFIESECVIIISTLEGDHLVRHGDYVVRGVYDEYYPVKPTIFEETYEQVIL